MAHLIPACLVPYQDANGNPLSGGKLFVYDAATTNEKDTYTSSSLTVGQENVNPLVANSNGYFDAAYIADGDTYKLVLKDSTEATTFFTRDNLQAPEALGGAGLTQPYESKSSDYILVVADSGKFIDFDATAAARTVTADSSDLGNGFTITIGKIDASTNAVTVTPGGGETINGESTWPLQDRYESVTLVSMGATGWRVQSATQREPQGEVPAIVTESTTARTLGITDKGKYIRCTSGSATTITVPANATTAFPTGTRIEIIQAGAGEVTIAAAGGVTINSVSSWKDAVAQYSAMVLTKVDTNTWDLVGDIEA